MKTLLEIFFPEDNQKQPLNEAAKMKYVSIQDASTPAVINYEIMVLGSEIYYHVERSGVTLYIGKDEQDADNAHFNEQLKEVKQ